MRAWRLALLVLAVALLCPLGARGYVVTTYGGVELRWTSMPMKFSIHNAAAPGLIAASTQAAIRAAYKTWSTVSCSSFDSQDLGVVNLPWGDKNDHINTHAVTPSWPSSYASNALGITWMIYDGSTGRIFDADTHYNPSYTWAVNGSSSAIDLQSVATHEIGHQLGLDHSPVQAATMFYQTGAGDMTQRSLHSDDIAGLCYLYPSGKPLPPECTVPEHCAPNETCSAGKCVSASPKGYGSPCTTPKDCVSEVCIVSGANSFCSQLCNSAPCPDKDQCVTLTGGTEKACIAGSGTWASKALGEPCKVAIECKTNLCSPISDKGYLCVQKCDPAKQNCPTGFTCTPTGPSGLCTPGTPTPPPAKKKNGELCTVSADCESGLCGQDLAATLCLQPCTIGAAGCPAGTHCAKTSGGQLGCMKDTAPPDPVGTAGLGESCEKDSDCASKLCFDDGQGQLYCSQTCEPDPGCEGEFDCTVQGESQLCTPRLSVVPAASSGCVLSPARPSERAAAGWLVLLLTLAALFVLGRRR